MNFLRRGEATQKILNNTYRPPAYERESETKPHPASCPKCGKIIGRGRFMHVKHCKGMSNGKDPNSA